MVRSPSNVETYEINSCVVTIKGEGTGSYAFLPSRSTLTTVIFKQNSNLVTIESFAFYACNKLSNISLLSCTKLTTIGACAFQSCSSLEYIDLPSSVTSIGSAAFKSSGLISFTPPPEITALNGSLFYSCSKLTTLNISKDSKITSFGYMFLYGTNVSYIYLPKDLTSFSFEGSQIETFELSPENTKYRIENNCIIVGSTVVAYPAGLKSNATIPSGIVMIATVSFSYSKTEYITIPNTVRIIEAYAFFHSSLKELELPDSITTMYGFCFYGSNQLSKIKLPANIQNLPGSAFTGANISEITIPSSVRSIGGECFTYCPNLKKVILPDSLQALYGRVFDSGINLTFGDDSKLYLDDPNLIMKKDNTEIVQHIGMNSELQINVLASVEIISSNAFRGKDKIVNISFPKDSALTKIYSGAFSMCTNLHFINLPNTLSVIGSDAFSKCNNLISISSNNLESLGAQAFYQCINLQNADFSGSSFNELGAKTFFGCYSLSELHLPKVGSFGESCFYGCSKLTSLFISDNLSSIGESCFERCSISSFDFSQCNNLTVIPNYAFRNNIYLTNIIFSPNLASIGLSAFAFTSISVVSLTKSTSVISDLAFDSCGRLTTFNIPADCALTPTKIGLNIFRNCSSFRPITCMSDKFEIVTDALFTKGLEYLVQYPPASATKFFVIPGSTRYINQYAFYGCLNLESVFIPTNSVKLISNNAFEGCFSLKWINIPACVQTIGKDAFLNCRKLRCGITVENSSSDFISQVTSSGINKNALRECFEKSCPIHNSRFDFFIFFISPIIIL